MSAGGMALYTISAFLAVAVLYQLSLYVKIYCKRINDTKSAKARLEELYMEEIRKQRTADEMDLMSNIDDPKVQVEFEPYNGASILDAGEGQGEDWNLSVQSGLGGETGETGGTNELSSAISEQPGAQSELY